MKMRFACFVMLAAGLVACGQRTTPSVELFNGHDLTGWVAVTADSTAVSPFSVAEGCIRVAGQPFGYLRTAEAYGDYRLHVEWRWIGQPSNSGLFQRIQEGDGIWPTLIECQLEAGNAGDLLSLNGAPIDGAEPMSPSVLILKNRGESSERPAGEWNEADIECRGDRITVRINGVLQNECTGADTRGYLALQSEGGPLEFRNVRLTPLDE